MKKQGGSDIPGARVSAPVYFICVVGLTALGFWIATLLRPTLAYSVKDLLGIQDSLQATPNSFYTARVAPLLEEHCIGCHGERRQKGKLRLDSFAAAMRGGKHGPVIKPGNAQDSELMARLLLPPTDDKAMPPEGKPPLKPDEVTVIKLWIAAGASGVQPVEAIKGAPKPVAKIKFAEIDPVAVEKERAALAAAVKELQKRFPGVISYESRGSADLEINASLLGEKFGDAELAALAPLHDRIVRADLSGTAVGDASASTLVSMKRLKVLRLLNTKIGDATIRALTNAGALQSLAVVGASVSDQALQPLRNKGVKIYDDRSAQESSDGKG